MNFLKTNSTIGTYRVGDRIDSRRYDFREVYQVADDQNPDGTNYALIVYDVEAWRKKVGVDDGCVTELETYGHLRGDAFPKSMGNGELTLDDGKLLAWNCLQMITGERLDTLIRDEKTFTCEAIIRIGIQLTKAAREISFFQNGGGHYNLHPENVFLSSDDEENYSVQVCGLTHVGKPYNGRPCFDSQDLELTYCAPESVWGIYSEISDIYAIGRIMKKLAEVSDLSESSSANSGLWQVIHRACCKRRSERYPSLVMMRKDLGKWAEAIKSSTDEAEKGSPSSSSRRRDDTLRFDGVIDKRKGKGFSAIAGCEELKDNLRCNFVSIFQHQELARKMGIQPPNSILLFGPPGNGKSFFAERLAEELDIKFTMVTPSSLASSFLHGTQQIMADLFQKLEKEAPVLIAFDEFDAIAPNRATDYIHHQSGEVNELLTQLNNAADRGIYVLMMTNYPERVDPAILRKGRVDNIIYMGLPDDITRKQIFELELSTRMHEKNLDYDELSRLTKNFSSSDITYIVKEAARRNFNYCVKEMVTRPIPFDLIKEVISQTVPSVSPEQLRHYEKVRQQMLQQTPPRQRIGF